MKCVPPQKTGELKIARSLQSVSRITSKRVVSAQHSARYLKKVKDFEEVTGRDLSKIDIENAKMSVTFRYRWYHRLFNFLFSRFNVHWYWKRELSIRGLDFSSVPLLKAGSSVVGEDES